jgi:hypothetical protein
MKFYVDQKEVCELNETQCKVLKHHLDPQGFKADMERRVAWVIMHKYERCLERLKKEWIPKLKNKGLASLPLDDDEFAKLVFAQPDYKPNRSTDE